VSPHWLLGEKNDTFFFLFRTDNSRRDHCAMSYSYYTELGDPVEAFLKSDGKCNRSENNHCSLTKASQMSHTLLWRQDPDETFSDWRIEIKPDEAIVVEDECSSLSDHALEVFKDDAESDDDHSKSTDSNISDDDSMSILDTEAAPKTTFHVHQNILASVSKFLRSQLSRHIPTTEQ
jgi:hypothetical protein